MANELRYVLCMRPRDAANRSLTGAQAGLCQGYKRYFAEFRPLDANLSMLLSQIIVLPLETVAKAKALNANGAPGPLKLAKLLTMELKKSAGHHPDLLPKDHFKLEHQKSMRIMDDYQRKRAAHRAAKGKGKGSQRGAITAVP